MILWEGTSVEIWWDLVLCDLVSCDLAWAGRPWGGLREGLEYSSGSASSVGQGNALVILGGATRKGTLVTIQ